MTSDAVNLLDRDATSAQDLDIVLTGPPRPSRRGPRLIAASAVAAVLAGAAWLGLLLPAILIAVLVVGTVLLMPHLRLVLQERRSREEREGEAMATWFANLRTSNTWNDDDAPARRRVRPHSPAGRHRATR